MSDSLSCHDHGTAINAREAGSTWVAETAPTFRRIPDLDSWQYGADRRFAQKTKDPATRPPRPPRRDLRGPRDATSETKDPGAPEGWRQYVRDHCRSLVTRKPTGAPKFDGQYKNLLEIEKGQGDPLSLKMKWLSGWDATWWCTACWCRNAWKINGPLDETKHKDPMRLHLKIVTTRMLDDLHYGSQRYCAQPRPGHRSDRRAEAQSDDCRYAVTDARWRGQPAIDAMPWHRR